MKNVFIAVAMIAISSSPAFAHTESADHFYDAMHLAIAHFNANHTKPLESWGPEHRFMYDLLNEVAQQVPEVATLSEIPRSVMGQQDPFASLHRELYMADPVRDRAAFAAAAELNRVIGLLTPGCATETETVTRSSTSSRGTRSETTTKTTYALADFSGRTECTNAVVAQKLGKLGIARITVFEDPSFVSGRYTTVTTSPATNIWRDMGYVKAQMMADSDMRDLGALLEVIDLSQGRIGGKASGISVTGSSGAASFTDKVTLTYSAGWGDCPSGCIHEHQWLIEVTPTASTSAGKYDYAVKVISESGDPVPPGGIPRF